jgi:hypothetical protein
MTTDARSLTPRQVEVLAAVDHYQEALGEPAPAAHVARTLGVSHERVRAMFRSLNALGWLRGPASPAALARALPGHDPLEKIQLPDDELMPDSPAMAARQPSLFPPERASLPPGFVEMPPLSLRADVAVQSADIEGRTVELIFSTGAPVERYDWMNDCRYLETLGLDPKNVRLDRLNSGGPLLDAHGAYSVADILGSVVPGSVSLAKAQARCTVRFSRRAEVEPVWQDVRDGIIRSVSVGYRVYKFVETSGEGNALPVREAVDWEPFEVSMVPIPADAGAKVRGERSAELNPCEIVTRSEGTVPQPAANPEPPKQEQQPANPGSKKETRAMDPKTQSEFVVEHDEDAPVHRRAPAPAKTDIELAREAERARNKSITDACRAVSLPQSFMDTLRDSGKPWGECSDLIFAEVAKRGGDNRNGGGNGGGQTPTEILVGDDPLVHKRAAVENAILHRVAPDMLTPPDAEGKQKQAFPLSAEGREYMGMGLLDIARMFLRARGIRTNGLSKIELAGVALSARDGMGMHTVSDFPKLLADVTNKVLRMAYDAAPQTFLPLVRSISLPDFKTSKQLQLGEAPALMEVLEHGEFTSGTITESKEEFGLKTYGRKFAITRTSLINDDLSAFSRVPMAFGRAARNKESDIVWALITANAALADTIAIFHASHANLAGSGGAISVTTIGAGRAAMRIQTGLDGATLMNVSPRYLVVPAAKETLADQFVSTALLAYQAAQVNPFAGRLTVISEPRLDANSATAWYLFASPDQIDMILTANLEGQSGPTVENRLGFEIDGLEIKCRHDFGAKVVDFRGMYKDPGA